jgi:hypothetical protein
MGEAASRRNVPAGEADPVLAEIVHRLVAAYEPERIYLFGSRARGDAGSDSDYDLLVVVPDGAPPERRRSRLAYEVLWGIRTGSARPRIAYAHSNLRRKVCARVCGNCAINARLRNVRCIAPAAAPTPVIPIRPTLASAPQSRGWCAGAFKPRFQTTCLIRRDAGPTRFVVSSPGAHGDNFPPLVARNGAQCSQ